LESDDDVANALFEAWPTGISILGSDQECAFVAKIIDGILKQHDEIYQID
jgi:hypothetical protein